MLWVQDLGRSTAFYREVLGRWQVERHGVVSMHFEGGAVGLVQDPSLLQPSPTAAAHGAATVCLRASGTVAEWQERLRAASPTSVAGPPDRVGSAGAVHSLYVRDPDGNVVELDLSTRA